MFDDAFWHHRPGFEARAWARAVPRAWVVPLAWAARRVYSALRDCTFWVNANSEPQTLLERFALKTFWTHMQAAGYSREDVAQWGPQVGAEWWVQRREAGQPPARRSIAWHFDQDQILYGKHGLLVNPYLATVTYLSASGAPTVCLSQPTIPQASDGSCVEGLGPGASAKAYVSYPALGKHLAFDGRLLHGCPSALKHHEGERLSLLVNLWLGHRPVDITRGHAIGGRGMHGLRPRGLKLLDLDLLPVEVKVLGPVRGSSRELKVEVGPWRFEGVRIPRGMEPSHSLSRICFGRGSVRAVYTE